MMKRITLIAAAFFASSSAMAIDASNTFTWTGTVPAAPVVGNNWVIKSPTGQDLTNGIMVFRLNADGKGELTGSTELAFNVFSEQAPGVPDVAAPANTYTIELTSLAVNSAGLASEQDANGYFGIIANGAALAKGTPEIMTGDTRLIVGVQNDAAANQPLAGDSVDLQATLVVTNAQI
ncbi:hypothetical protein RIMD111065_33260 [Aeromonas hydrophila]|nr:hypothetical protein RIMD111065_33260 [Aeromonas hydrophila]